MTGVLPISPPLCILATYQNITPKPLYHTAYTNTKMAPSFPWIFVGLEMMEGKGLIEVVGGRYNICCMIRIAFTLANNIAKYFWG